MLGRVCPNLPYPSGSLPVRATRIVMALPERTGRPTVAGAAPAAPVLHRRSTLAARGDSDSDSESILTGSRLGTRPGIVMAQATAS
jgi:hypothetical protein